MRERPGGMVEWSVVVFGRNEAESIARCLDSAFAALGHRRSEVHAIINGSTDGTPDVLRRLKGSYEHPLFCYEIAFGDKANAWNQFVYRISRPAEIYFFVDAYAFVGPQAFTRLAGALARHPSANAATGVPGAGRSAAALARQLKSQGGIHGSLHALPRPFVDRIRARKLQLPIGLYRGDGLIGSMVAHDLDSLHEPWVPSRSVVVDDANWTFRTLSPWRLGDVKRQFNRMVQQARGRYENYAIKRIIYERGYEGLPRSADQMILDLLAAEPAPLAGSLTDRFFQRLALRRIPPLRAIDEAMLSPREL